MNNASLGLLLDIGIEQIQNKLIENADYLITALTADSNITILSPTQEGRYAGIITFQKQQVDNVTLYQHLQDHDVICAFRGDGIRFSPHFYTESHRIDKAIEMVRDFRV